jgi:hypothetical protein
MDPQGRFVVVWESYGQDGSNYGVFGQRYDAAESQLGGEFPANTYTTSQQKTAAVATDAQGRFVVVWASDQDGSSFGVFGQRYDAAGGPAGSEFRINAYTTGNQTSPAVAMDPAGNFVAVWQSEGQDGSASGIFGQRYDGAGTPRGAEFRVNGYTTSFQTSPAVSIDRLGNSVVVWESDGQDGSDYGVFGQRYDAAGAPRGPEFRVNTQTIDRQATPAVAVDAVGNFVVIWTSDNQDGSSAGIFGQRYGGLRPAALTVDATGNGVLEAGETATVAPAWHNVNGAPVTFTGTASDLTGPFGASYALTDTAGNYGNLAAGATGSCGSDCYQVTVSLPATRPALHWDLTLRETIGPPSLGQMKIWTLHVGASFPDVPPAHRSTASSRRCSTSA